MQKSCQVFDSIPAEEYKLVLHYWPNLLFGTFKACLKICIFRRLENRPWIAICIVTAANA